MSVSNFLLGAGIAPEERDFLGWSSLTPPLQLSGCFTAGHPLTLRVNPSPKYPWVRISCVFVQSVIILVRAVTISPQWVHQAYHLSEVSGMSSSPLLLVSFGFVCKLKFVWGFGLVPRTSLPAYHGITASLRHIHLLWHEVPPGLQVSHCSPMVLHGWKGPSCLTLVCYMELPPLLHQEGLLSSFFTGLGVCRDVSHILIPLSSSCVEMGWGLLPLLKFIIPKVPSLLLGLASDSDGSGLEQAGISSVRHGGASDSFSLKAALYLPNYHEGIFVSDQYKLKFLKFIFQGAQKFTFPFA